jgi:hypothetical protein
MDRSDCDGTAAAALSAGGAQRRRSGWKEGHEDAEEEHKRQRAALQHGAVKLKSIQKVRGTF